MRSIHVLSLLTFSALATACGGEATTTASSGSPSAKPAASTVASSKASAAAPAASAAPAAPAAPAGALADLDLSPGGAAFKGLKAKAPEGTKVADDGAGGASIAISGDVQITLATDVKLIKDMKEGVKAGAEAVKGKITFANDKPDTLDYVTELTDVDGKAAKLHGFVHTIDVGGKKMLCSLTGVEKEEDLAVADAFCKSVTK